MGFDRSIPPIAVAPDESSYVRLRFSEVKQSDPALLVFNTDGTPPCRVVVDRAGTRFPGRDGLDATWLAHYYQWQHEDGGANGLVARAGVTLLPQRGVVAVESGSDLVYRLHSAKVEMVDVLSALLVSEFKAQRTAADGTNNSHRLRIDGREVTVFNNESSGDVVDFLQHGSEMSLVRRIADRFNLVLASGKYDAKFAY